MKLQHRNLIFLLLAGILSIWSCTDNASSSNPDPLPPDNPNIASKDIGPGGGEISSKDEKLTLTIPEGALDNTETITIEPISPDKLGLEFDSLDVQNAWELNPEGLQFEQPVTVRFETNQNPTPDDTTLSVTPELLLISDGETVEPLDSLTVKADADNGIVAVRGRLAHFSYLASVLIDRQLDKAGINFLVHPVPNKVVLGRNFNLRATLLDRDNLIRNDPPFYDDFSKEPVKLNGDNKSIPMEKNNESFSLSLVYYCSGLGNGTFEALTALLSTSSFYGGATLSVAKEVECVQGGAVEGRVTVDGEGIASVDVFSDKFDAQNTVTDAEGNYRLENVLPGDRDISISQFTLPEGAQCDETKKTVTVEPGKTTAPVDFECFTEGNETASVTVEEFTADDKGGLTAEALWRIRYMAPGSPTLKCYMNWDDGSEKEEVDCGEVSEDDDEVRTGTANHTYRNGGSFTLQLRVEFPDLDIGDTNETEVTVEEPQEFTLTVSTSGLGSGIVTSKPEGINTSVEDPDEESYTEGTQVELTATSDEGSIFAGWSGDCAYGGEMLKVTVTMDSDKSCDAQFNNDPLSDALPTGIWELPPINNLEDVEKLFNESTNGNGNNAPSKSFPSISQEEVLFGNLTGTFPVAIAGAEGYVVIDLLNGGILLDETDVNNSGPLFGVVGATQEPPGSSAALLLAFGQNDYIFNRFDRFGSVVSSNLSTFDAYPAAGEPVGANVVSYVQPNRGVKFWIYDDNQGIYIPTATAKEFDDALFEGELVSAYLHNNTFPIGPTLVLTREQQSGLYLTMFNESDNSPNVTRVADLGLDARKVRCVEVSSGNLICAVSVFGDDRLAILTWDGETEPTLVDFVDVGDGPVGIDLRLLANRNIGVVSTGFNDNTVTITELSPSGDVVGNNTQPVLEGCQSPGHAIFVHDSESLKIVGTCYDSGTYFIMDSEL